MELQMVNVTRKFGVFCAVDNLNLTINSGVYGLLGVNGAGKTTLMRMICTLLSPTSGQILCDGKDIFQMDGEFAWILTAGVWILSRFYSKGLSDVYCQLKGNPSYGSWKTSKRIIRAGGAYKSC